MNTKNESKLELLADRLLEVKAELDGLIDDLDDEDEVQRLGDIVDSIEDSYQELQQLLGHSEGDA